MKSQKILVIDGPAGIGKSWIIDELSSSMLGTIVPSYNPTKKRMYPDEIDPMIRDFHYLAEAVRLALSFQKEGEEELLLIDRFLLGSLVYSHLKGDGLPPTQREVQSYLWYASRWVTEFMVALHSRQPTLQLPRLYFSFLILTPDLSWIQSSRANNVVRHYPFDIRAEVDLWKTVAEGITEPRKGAYAIHERDPYIATLHFMWLDGYNLDRYHELMNGGIADYMGWNYE